MFHLHLDRARTIELNLEKEPIFKKVLKIIEEDLHRTFGELGHFRYGNKLYQPLRNILVAFAVSQIRIYYFR